jgi:hypothetical protein
MARQLTLPDASAVWRECQDGAVRHTEFWRRMEEALGSVYARSWAENHVLADLGGRTVNQALADGEPPKAVWRAVWTALDLPPRDR